MTNWEFLAYVLGADKGKKTKHVATHPKQRANGPASFVKGKETPLGTKQTLCSKVASLLYF